MYKALVAWWMTGVGGQLGSWLAGWFASLLACCLAEPPFDPPCLRTSTLSLLRRLQRNFFGFRRWRIVTRVNPLCVH